MRGLNGKELRGIEFRDFSKGTIRTVNPSIVPKNSYKAGINLRSDKEIGSLISRDGTDILGVQMRDGATCLGLHQHVETAGTALFGVFSDGVNNDIYFASSGAKSLEDDTKDLKTRFCTFLGATVRVNGTDDCKSYTSGGGWITTAGAFDLGSMPKGKVVIEWKDRVYVGGKSGFPGIVFYSSIADPSTKTISWTDTTTTTGGGQIQIEQEDNGGDITALLKVPGYLIIFKERTMKRWDGNTTFPEDMIKQGVFSQECVCSGKEMGFFINKKGIWATNGGYPVRISKPIQDFVEAIPGENWSNVAITSDDEHLYCSIGDITIGNEDYTNVVLVYNIGTESWDVFSYYNDFRVFGIYIDSNSIPNIVGGDTDGQILQINTGNTDYNTTSTTVPITYSLETQDMEFGSRALVKHLNELFIYTENISSGQVKSRKNSSKPEDWESVGSIRGVITDLKDLDISFNFLDIKITGVTDKGPVKILGFDFPDGSVLITDNINE